MRMECPMRVLVVEHRQADSRIAAQLLADYALDFSWQFVESPLELRRIAADDDFESRGAGRVAAAVRADPGYPRYERARNGRIDRPRRGAYSQDHKAAVCRGAGLFGS